MTLTKKSQNSNHQKLILFEGFSQNGYHHFFQRICLRILAPVNILFWHFFDYDICLTLESLKTMYFCILAFGPLGILTFSYFDVSTFWRFGLYQVRACCCVPRPQEFPHIRSGYPYQKGHIGSLMGAWFPQRNINMPAKYKKKNCGNI